MASRHSEETPSCKFFYRTAKIRFLKNSACFVIILVLCSGPIVCSICCAIETSPSCCGSGLETARMPTAPTIPGLGLDGCCSPNSEGLAHKKQASGPAEKLSEPIDESGCCSVQTRTDGLAVLPRGIDGRLIADRAPAHSALFETVEPPLQLGRFAPVMNRGSTYLRFCVLLI